MKVIVGLGNPGREYEETRHNIGFKVIGKLANENNISVTKNKHKALIGDGIIVTEKVMLVMPQTFMNLSGESVGTILNFYKIDVEDLIVVYDDISLNVGDLRIRQKGSAGGHNGMKNIIAHLGTDNFIRIKVGVGNKPQGRDLADYVLSKFPKNESEIVTNSIEDCSKCIQKLIKDGIISAMNEYNQRKKE